MLLATAPLAGCGEGGAREDALDPAAVGQCAVDVQSGALIGEIVETATDPETGRAGYRVQLETDPSDTAFVGAGTNVRPSPPARPGP